MKTRARPRSGVPRRRRQVLRGRLRWTTLTGLVLSGLLLPMATPRAETVARVSRTGRTPFVAPAGLRPQIDFWKNIFATYSTDQVVLHDTLHLSIVYEVLDFRQLASAGVSVAEIEAIKRRTVDSERKKIRAILTRLHRLPPGTQAVSGLSDRERRIWALFRDVKGRNRFREAAAEDRLRAQSGLRERFARGIERGTRYWPEIERVFRAESVPLEITRLPLIESSFEVRAYSRKGAVGVWQFMPSTGRRFMRIDDAVDERRDPIFASRAAARYLRSNYEALGTWPLAITAYNHGEAGIARAVAAVGSTDIVDIVRKYRGPSFKFASRNFYAEFLAAVELERNAPTYFGELNYEPPLQGVVVRVPHYVKLTTLARCAATSVETLVDLNPALSREVIDGKLRVPHGYSLRLPPDTEKRFRQRYAVLSPDQKFTTQAKRYVVHKVRRGQTLTAIARKYGTTVRAIQKRNNFRRTLIRTGETLRIPLG